jgi:serine protease Do
VGAPPATEEGSAPAKEGQRAQPGGKEQKKEPPIEERAARGVVVLERGGQMVGLGAVLAGDGRILSALSPLGHGNDLDARYPDGSIHRVKVGHHDRVWDLAMLVPQTGKWKEGLTASARDPVRQDATIRSFSAARGKVAAVPVVLRGHRPLLGGDDRPLDDVLELGSRVTPQDLGAPLIDEEGRVVGILGRGCAPNEGGKPCTPVAFGAPIHAIKSFLRSVPPTAVQPSGWLGIQGVGESGAVAKGVRVTSVHPGSPADEAQLKGGERSAGDMILAVDGVPVTSPEALADAIKTHAVGEKVPLIVLGADGKYRQVTVALRSAPDPKAAPSSTPAHPAELPPLDNSRRRNPASLPR